MNLPSFIARRYFLSKRKKNFINIISFLSMAGVAFSTAALIVVLSVFNGLEELLRSLYNSFDPPLKIEAVMGKSFELSDSLLSAIKKINDVEIVTEVIEDYAYLRYNDADIIVTVKGVSNNFIDQHRLDNKITSGKLQLYSGEVPMAIIGSGVRNTLSVDINSAIMPLQVFYIKNIKGGILAPSQLYSNMMIMPGAVFSIEKNTDENFIFVPIAFAMELMNYQTRRTSLEVKTGNQADPAVVQKDLKDLLGSGFKVLNNDEQHGDLYRLLKVEKLFVFLSFSILILVASINIFFSLMMLALDKKKDIAILASMGAAPSLIRRIFIYEGFIISGIGASLGLLFGAGICWLQQQVGLVSMGMENAVVPDYPVKMIVNDFVFTGLVLITITLLVSIRPARLAGRYTAVELL